MPTVQLKEKSPEFDTNNANRDKTKVCEIDGCHEKGDFKAPKHRGLNEYYHFCLEHVQEYNKSWDFFDGMNDEEVQDHILKSATGFRPTWKFSDSQHKEESVRKNIFDEFFSDSNGNEQQSRKEHFENSTSFHKHSPEFEAMAIMGLEPPLTWDEIKTEYKKLAKKHHPDMNNGSKEAEEQLKKINMAYTVLKLAYEQYKIVEEKMA